ncbi:MAG TPA: FG-GAP repeat protein [Polyangia bacterium]|nr:FG-GAP repeat protein [Polyangia bacterium]
MWSALKYLVALGTAGVLVAGCDWRDFDTLQNQVPVQRVDAPSGFSSSNDFASSVLPLTPPTDGSTAAWFLASGTENLGLALVKVDAAGHPSGQTISGPALDSLFGDPITAMAEIPGAETALLGAPTAPNSLLTIDLATATPSAFTPASPPSEGLFGNGLAAGKLTGGASPDFVVTSLTSIHVFVGGATTGDLTPSAADLAACPPIALSAQLTSNLKASRAVVIGNLLGSGPVVALGTPGLGMTAGTVSFFTVTASAVTCAGSLAAPALTPATTTNVGFGGALAVGDFDGDGAADLLVGASPNAVYLYKGPLAPGATPTATISPPDGSGEFGSALAAMNIDGMKGDEALIGDPGATVNDQTGAGRVTIYTGPKLATMLAPTSVLTDHDLSAGEQYGGSVGALSFCAVAPCATPPRLPLVGAPSHAFLYFTLGPTDPRAM